MARNGRGTIRRRTPRARRRAGWLLLRLVVAGGLVLAGFVTVAFIDANWRFAHRATPTPVRLFSAPFVLAPGTVITREDLNERLRRLGYRRVASTPRTPGEFTRRSRTFEIALNPFDYPEGRSEALTARIRITFNRVTRLENAATGERLPEIRLEPEPLGVLSGDVHEERIPVALEDLPRALLDAVVAVEDRRYYKHPGIDPRGVLRALMANIRSGGVVQGGSTITQQLAKNLYPGNGRRTITQKVWETMAAFGLEAFRSKRSILKRYLNEIYLAQRGPFSIIGVGAAARHYFGKEARYLDLPESALIAGLIRSPGRYHPYRHPDAARDRRDLVLRLMRDLGSISEEEFRSAVAAPLLLRLEPSQQPRHAPYFVVYVAEELKTIVPRDGQRESGLLVFTTLDPLLQARAESILEKKLGEYERGFRHLRKLPGGAIQGALVALRPSDGSVLAMVGGRSYRDSQFNRVTQAHRQPGSLFKPFVFLAGFLQAQQARDSSFTPATVLDDSPLEVEVGGKPWSPRNYDGTFRGPVSARQSLALSLNVPTIRAAESIGLGVVVRMARRCGITSPLMPVPSLALGTFEVTPLEIASAFTAIANLGVRAAPRAVTGILRHDGRSMKVPEPILRGAASAQAAYLTLDLMRDVLKYGTGSAIGAFRVHGDLAGKTGTTDEGRDAWFVGLNPDFLGLVWVGFDNNRPLRLGGSTLALPIWAALAAGAGLDDDLRWEPPEGLVRETVDPGTGQLAGWRCPETVSEIFIQGTEPRETCEHDRRRYESWTRRLYKWLQRD